MEIFNRLKIIVYHYRLEMAQVSETPVLVDSESEDEEDLVMDKEEEEEDGASVYSDESDVSDIEEEQDQGEEGVKTKPICDNESGKESAAVVKQEPEAAPVEAKELEWRLAYSGPETSTEIRDLAPATQYQVMTMIMTMIMS